ncbi:MAG TPA: aminopeptidase [Rhodanobacteraceae bacterium]|jgi:predicted aminopeptidase|nr:aminopeptidase [Rhodanobacteraceae bacterium]
MPALALRTNILPVAGILAALSLSACSTLGYYGHLAQGQYAMLAARQPIARIIADPTADATLKARLRLADQARAFASDKLGLPRNASYTDYADLKRPYATWNVFAAPEFSVQAVENCYLLVGCLAYRGYFDRERADAEAVRLQAKGLDTWVGGSAAYSTLGWFADPILNTMLRWDDDELAATIFHELAHQRLFVKGDTEFNESFATFVQYEGLREWRVARGLPPDDDIARKHQDEFEQIVLDARERLRVLYATTLPTDVMRARKHEEIERLRADYFRLRDTQWDGKGGYDDWIKSGINNAKLLPFGLYRRWVPAFTALFARQSDEWTSFYAAAEKIAHLDAVARTKALSALQDAER